jgi:hypothetical protein
MLWVFGVASGLLQAMCIVPYVRDTLARTTKPHRGTWAIFTTLSVIVVASQRADGGSWSLTMAVVQLAGCAAILSLAFSRGVGGTSRGDVCLLAIAAAGVAGWYLAGDPTVATLCVVLADMVAVAMMVPKTYADPYSETLSTFALSGLSTIPAMLAVGALDFGLLVYPGYVLCADLLVVGIIVARRPRVGCAPA